MARQRGSDAFGPVYAQIVTELVKAGVSEAELERILGVSSAVVGRWSRGETRPRGYKRDFLVGLHIVIDVLASRLAPDALALWLRTPNRALGGVAPVDVLPAGGFDAVRRAAEVLPPRSPKFT